MSKAYKIFTLTPLTKEDLCKDPGLEGYHTNYDQWESIGDISAPISAVAVDFIKNKEPNNHIVGWEVEDFNKAKEAFCEDKHGTVEDLHDSDFIAVALRTDIAYGNDAFFVFRADLVHRTESVVYFNEDSPARNVVKYT